MAEGVKEGVVLKPYGPPPISQIMNPSGEEEARVVAGKLYDSS